MAEESQKNAAVNPGDAAEEKAPQITENQSQDETGISPVETGNIGGLTSPEGILMLATAGLFDAIGLLGFIPEIGWIIELISDGIAAVVFAAWMIITGRKGWWRLVLGAVIESIPYIDDIAPFISLTTMLLGIKFPTSWLSFVYSSL